MVLAGIYSFVIFQIQLFQFCSLTHSSVIGEIERAVGNQRSSLQSVNFESDLKLIQVIRTTGSYFYSIEDLNLENLIYFAKGQTCLEKKVFVLESDDDEGAGEEPSRKTGNRKPIRILVKGNWVEENHRIFHLAWIYYKYETISQLCSQNFYNF